MARVELDASIPMARRERPTFDEAQKEQIAAAVGRLMLATLRGQSAGASDAGLGSFAGQTVSGAFVSLKRGRHLRSCCGFLGQPLPLASALQEAAERTVWEDVRFPPVSLRELPHLDFEVWLLHSQQPIRAQGRDRIDAVVVGIHGLNIARGQAHGLLLPSVAVQHQWDAERFLEQVCVKAGLHPTAWKDSATALSTFEGESFRGRIAESDVGSPDHSAATALRADELQDFAGHCVHNIVALLTGATPNYYFFGKTDGQVTGVSLSLRGSANVGDLSLSQISLRPGLPLQATLFKLAQAAAQTLAQRGLFEHDLQTIEANLALFVDPVMHGTVADPDLSGTEWDRRAIFVVERSRSGLVFDSSRGAEERLADAVRAAKVRRPETAAVFSLEALTAASQITISSVPRATPGPAVRAPSVAGKFYPSDPSELDRMVTELIGEATHTKAWPAALVPHAGLQYSGRIAASVFKRLQFPRTVIVLGPKHTPLGVDWAIAPHETWSLPGHMVAADPQLALELTREMPDLELDAQAHLAEHAIEVELPFIARLAPQTRVVGIAIGDGDWETCARFSEGLANVLGRRDDPPLLVISSDMNHYATDSENRRLDEMALAALEGLDPREVYETVTQNSISMCGVLPAVIVLQTLRLLGRLSEACRVSYATSADVTGDTSRVVGYAGMLFG
jgi:AmmeMemoRadiSam system protein B/AmmeMemoRadiSam system protein A